MRCDNNINSPYFEAKMLPKCAHRVKSDLRWLKRTSFTDEASNHFSKLSSEFKNFLRDIKQEKNTSVLSLMDSYSYDNRTGEYILGLQVQHSKDNLISEAFPVRSYKKSWALAISDVFNSETAKTVREIEKRQALEFEQNKKLGIGAKTSFSQRLKNAWQELKGN